MPLSFPASPALNATSTQNGRQYQWTGYAWELVAASGSGEDALLRSIFVPAAPTGLTATAGNAQAALAWTAPTGVIAQAPITDYREQYSTDNGATWTTFTTAASTASTATVTGLTNGTAYRFRVAAVNAVGVGAYTAASAAVTPAAVIQDPQFSNVTLLLHMDGTGSTFTDSSLTPKTVTAAGSATQSATQSKWGGKSLALDGTGDYLSATGALSQFGTSDFAVEFWLYYVGTGVQYSIFDTRSSNGGFVIYKADDDTLNVFTSSNIISGGAISADTWHHIALARSGSNMKLFLNGTQTGSTFSTLQDYSDQLLTVGGDFPRNGRWTQGYIDDVRITKGSARGYTGSTITVPTAAFPDS
jgi:hypothetical protein